MSNLDGSQGVSHDDHCRTRHRRSHHHGVSHDDDGDSPANDDTADCSAHYSTNFTPTDSGTRCCL